MKKIVKELQFKVIIEQDEDGIFVASVPAIPGCHTQGTTYEELLANVREVIELCLEEAEENNTYNDQIDWSETENAATRFIGVTQVPIKYAFPS